jgi:hypothetical protein
MSKYMVFGWDHDEYDVYATLTEFVGTTSELPENSELIKEIVQMPESMLQGRKFDAHVLISDKEFGGNPVLAFVKIGDKALD